MAKRTLQEDIRAHQTFGSLAPGARAAKPPKQEDAIPELRELVTLPREIKTLTSLILQYREAQLAEKEAKKVRDQIAEQLKVKLPELGLTKFQCEDLRISYSSSSRSSITRKSLLELNVDPAIIDQATKVTTFPLLVIRSVGEPEEEWSR